MKITCTGLMIILAVLSFACMRVEVLKDGKSKVAVNPKVYKNRAFFNADVMNEIDTMAIYEPLVTAYFVSGVKQHDTLVRLSKGMRHDYYPVFRFYGNGSFSEFYLKRSDSILNKEMFNPLHTGRRGVLYRKNGFVKGDIITQVGQNRGMLGRLTGIYNFKGDTLYVQETVSGTTRFVKRKINPELLLHIPTW